MDGDLILFQTKHEAPHLGRLHFRLEERSRVLRQGTNPFIGPAANDGSVGRFADDTIKDDDSP